jgi:hypothetical protein
MIPVLLIFPPERIQGKQAGDQIAKIDKATPAHLKEIEYGE